MGDFTGNSGREGRRARQGQVNVGFSAFHEGRGARKTGAPGGHDLVNRKKIVDEKERLQGKSNARSRLWKEFSAVTGDEGLTVKKAARKQSKATELSSIYGMGAHYKEKILEGIRELEQEHDEEAKN